MYSPHKKFDQLDTRDFSTSIEKNMKKAFIFTMGMWVVSVVTSFAFVSGVIYVAWHFINKYW